MISHAITAIVQGVPLAIDQMDAFLVNLQHSSNTVTFRRISRCLRGNPLTTRPYPSTCGWCTICLRRSALSTHLRCSRSRRHSLFTKSKIVLDFGPLTLHLQLPCSTMDSDMVPSDSTARFARTSPVMTAIMSDNCSRRTQPLFYELIHHSCQSGTSECRFHKRFSGMLDFSGAFPLHFACPVFLHFCPNVI
jgi:hypothetical protein